MDNSPSGSFCPWKSPGKNNWRGFQLPAPGDLPNPGIEPGSPAWQTDSLLSDPPGKQSSGQWVILTYFKPLPNYEPRWEGAKSKTNSNKKIPKRCARLSAYTSSQHFSSRQKKLPTNLSYDTSESESEVTQSDSLRPRELQPTRLLHPWDSPGKNTGVGCHFLLQRGRIYIYILSVMTDSCCCLGETNATLWRNYPPK